MKLLSSLLKSILKAVRAGVAALLAWMVLLAAAQLALRWFFNTGLSWADLQLRQMVLLIGLLGGVLAAAENRHICIDVTHHYLRGRTRIIVQRLIRWTAGACCLMLASLSVVFIRSEFEGRAILRGILFGMDLQQGYLEIAIPVAFALMGMFFLVEPETSSTLSGKPQ